MNIQHWFTGVVEDVNDPMQMGRVRVRCFNYHSGDTNDIPTEDLPWATCILPVTSAGSSGVGVSSTGLVPGSWVMGFFRDGTELQDPVVIGSIASISTEFPSGVNSGFADPNGFFPLSLGTDMPGHSSSLGYGSSDSYQSIANMNSNFNGVSVGYGSNTSTFTPPSVDLVRNGSVESLISITRSQLGIKETSKNQGPGIDKFWTATTIRNGYQSRLPWCAAFACWCIQQSGIFSEADRPKTAAAFGFEDWAKQYKINLRRRPTYVRKGDLVIFSFSHIGIASTDSDGNGRFKSIDGNTSDGVYEKNRTLSSVRSAITI